jgi:PTH1 family peptidyl-tRNA hydrolase
MERVDMSNIFDLFKKIEKNEPAMGPVSHLIVGLGNPGAEYAKTRHNAGFLFVDYVAERHSVRVDRARFRALVGEVTLEGRRVMLMKPQTFMNLSGEAVREAAAFYKIPPENVIVIADDVNFAAGKLRVRPKGSDGGHNGLKNIIYQLQSDAFPRVKVGVGVKPHPEYDLAAWVLSEFSKEEYEALTASFGRIYDGVAQILKGDVPAAMQLCNGK